MRLTSDFWVSAFMRDVRARGGFAYLTRRGAEDAGAIFIRRAEQSGRYALFGPAPQSAYDESAARGDRLFMLLAEGSEAELDERLRRELDFDPDFWLVEVENFADLTAARQLKLVSAPKL